MTQEATEQVEVARFFSRARRIPIVIGKLPDGTSLPGGPYRLAQFGTGLVAAVLVYATRGLWNSGGSDLVLYGGIAMVFIAGVFLGAYLPQNTRNPAGTINAGFNVLKATSAGNHRGKPLHLPTPVRTKIPAITITEACTPPPVTAPAAPPEATPTPAVSTTPPEPEHRPDEPPLPRTGLERLLAQTTTQ